MNPTTIIALKKWMADHCYNDHYFAIMTKPHLFQGEVLEYAGGMYNWYYTERGGYDLIKSFKTEEEAVKYIFPIIAGCSSAKSHMIAFHHEKQLIAGLLEELTRRGVAFEVDRIPYNDEHKFHQRVFVHGCDIKKVRDLDRKVYDYS